VHAGTARAEWLARIASEERQEEEESDCGPEEQDFEARQARSEVFYDDCHHDERKRPARNEQRTPERGRQRVQALPRRSDQSAKNGHAG
jgi:hypothetical protein